ncbi:MAG: SH3 domain-containing protein [Bacteroides sp.]|nr:SH3 domain-containing protein [Bacteroides sp.]MCM1550191.1 SH3 domain-containing protein [Clostridium sp.]
MKAGKPRIKKIVSIGLSVILTLGLFQISDINHPAGTVMAETIAQITPGTTSVNVRKSATTASVVLTQVNGGQPLKILDQPNASWYHVTFTKGNTTYTGYVHADYVSTTSTGNTGALDGDFEAYLTAQGFPESYKPYLRELHAAHTEWKFVAVQTGLDWNTVIENERNKQGQIKNLIYGTGSAPHYNWRETSVGYNWEKDSWSAYDGTTWFAASRDIVAYYMDPRNYLQEPYVFAFEQLSYDSSVHNAAGVEAILANTFMANSCPAGESRTFSAEIMEAAAAYNVSPYHLASRIRQEMGSTPGVNATGTSPNYPGIFNFYNVGSVDTAGGGAVNKGLAWAAMSGSYGRPWNSAAKAIMGGAQFIGSSYINRGQDTLYTQKFNVTYTASLYGHQYMTNIQAPSTEARSVYNAYTANGLIQSPLVFKIPVYTNMPDGPAVKPIDSGSPNNWLSTLIISGYSLTPSFSGGTTDYSLIVGNEVGSVTVSAKAVHAKAGVSGLGTRKLAVGTNQIPVTVTAENGAVRTYTITIIRKDSSGDGSMNPAGPTVQTSYRISGTTISGVPLGTDTGTFISGLGLTNGTATVYKSDGITVHAGVVGTGDIVQITNGTSTLTYTIIIYGDVTGDGVVNALDLLKVQKHIIGAGSLSGVYLEAANVKKSGTVSALDLLKIQKHIIGAAPIEQ